MAITTKERTELRQELVGQGYSWEYIDEWQPKVSLYRHRTMVSPSGDVVSEAGTKLDNLPGNPDYVSRKARQGLLPWPPSDTCSCRWCAGRRQESKPEAPSTNTAEEIENPRVARGRRRMGRQFG
jgi:hypothetical protein